MKKNLMAICLSVIMLISLLCGCTSPLSSHDTPSADKALRQKQEEIKQNTEKDKNEQEKKDEDMKIGDMLEESGAALEEQILLVS